MKLAGIDTSTVTGNLIIQEDDAEPYGFYRLSIAEIVSRCKDADMLAIELPGDEYIGTQAWKSVMSARDTAIRIHDRLTLTYGRDVRLIGRDRILALVIGSSPRKDADNKLKFYLQKHFPEHYFKAGKGVCRNPDMRDAFAALQAGIKLMELEEIVGDNHAD